MNYENFKVDELRKIASKKGIKNSKQYKKAELVKVLQEYDKAEAEKKTKCTDASKNNKDKFIDSAPLETIIVFGGDVAGGKVRSAKMIIREEQKRSIVCETAYGKRFYVPYDNVIWVKTGSRFPRAIYNLLKGIKNE